MVNKVDGNNYYDYQKLKNVNIPNTGEKFSLDYKQNELQSESKSNKDKDADTSKVDVKSSEKSGVKLELSRQGQTAASSGIHSLDKDKLSGSTGLSSIIDTIRDFFSTAITAVKDFFYKIWNDPQPAEENSELSEGSGLEEPGVGTSADTNESDASDRLKADALSEFTDRLTKLDAQTVYRINNERLNREIQPYLRNGDLNRVMSLLTDNGKKSIARNSSLLTYYDKNGRMVEPSASDRERILHGDGNTRKL